MLRSSLDSQPRSSRKRHRIQEIPAFHGARKAPPPPPPPPPKLVVVKPNSNQRTVQLRALTPDDQQQWYMQDLANVYHEKMNMYYCHGDDTQLITDFRGADLVLYNQHAVFSPLGFPSWNVYNARDQRNGVFLRALYRRALEQLKPVAVRPKELTIYMGMCSEQKPSTRGELSLAAAVERLLFDDCVDKDQVKLVYSELGKFHLSKKEAIFAEKDVVNTQSNEFVRHFAAGAPMASAVLKINDKVYQTWSKKYDVSKPGPAVVTSSREDLRLVCRTPNASFGKIIEFVLQAQQRAGVLKNGRMLSLFDKKVLEILSKALSIELPLGRLPSSAQALHAMIKSAVMKSPVPINDVVAAGKCVFRSQFATNKEFIEAAATPTTTTTTTTSKHKQQS